MTTSVDPSAIDPTTASDVVDPSLSGTGAPAPSGNQDAQNPLNLPVDVGTARLDYKGDFSQPMVKLLLNNTDFRLTVVRREGNIVLSGITESISWTEEGPSMQMAQTPVFTGSVGLRQPQPWENNSLPHAAQIMAIPGVRNVDPFLAEGVPVNLDVNWGGSWTPVWQMRIEHPNLSLQDGTFSFDLVDGLALLSRQTDDFHYGTSSGRRRGWLAHEIAVDLGRRYQFPLGKLVRGKHYQQLSESKSSVLQVLSDAYTNETKSSGKQYVIRWQLDDAVSQPSKHAPPSHRDVGRLNVLPLQRSNILYTLADEIQTTQITSQQPGTTATAITVTATMKGHGGTQRKLSHTEVSKEGVQRYGYVHDTIALNQTVTSMADLVAKAKRALASRMRTFRQVELVHQGIPFIRRGDAIWLRLDEWGFKGKYAIAFVDRMEHTLQGGNYTMDLTLTFIDPLDPYQIKGNREAAQRQQKRAQRKGKK